MQFQILLSFLGASILLSLMPGPDNLFVLTESITKGKKDGIALSVGLSLGVLIHTTLAATGLSLILQESTTLFNSIKWLGAAYLLFLAYKTLGEKQNWEEKNNQIKLSIKAQIKKGFLMNIMNPKVALFFIAFLPQFIVTDGYNIIIQMMILGILFMLQSLIIFSGIAILSGQLTKYIQNKRFWSIAKWVKIGVLVSIAVFLAFT